MFPQDELHNLESSQFIHTLLPHEMYSPPISHVVIMDKVIKIEVSLGKELNITSSLTQTNQESILKLL